MTKVETNWESGGRMIIETDGDEELETLVEQFRSSLLGLGFHYDSVLKYIPE